MKSKLVALLFLTFCWNAQAFGQVGENNFVGREAKIINNASEHVTLSNFDFENAYRDRSFRFITQLNWTNSGHTTITAFEVVMLFYDPFNRQIAGPSGRWLIPGHDSANWAALEPGQTDGDGTIGYGSENAYTGIVYVRAIRFEDGTVWYSNQPDIEKKIAAAVPNLKEIGPIDPGAKPPPTP